ncbi:HXXEE domain-containing protein [Streptomyces sp. MUM 203J]|uniref:HXXEE domain-containing protein n=1 Tax=Streptomyces sp. MUM 203J TaxID=2791990 RepID=UPI001F043B4F|nr:HXXEE domain-containing protein [Streptomyces sp. MUM 203J]MCH0542538.1 HXXEE domain-containing protein [Streptomyces sp. MUM 203J]
MRNDDVNLGATVGLFAAWALHDAEEIAFGPRWTRTRLPGLRDRFPSVPERVWRAMESVDQREFTAAVGVMGAVVAGAAVAGARTGGRSGFYQGALTGFGLHGLVHMAQAAVVRGYTPGSVTSPLVVVPFTLWARGRLRRAGVLKPTRARDAAAGLALAAGATILSHTVARRITGARPEGRKPGRTLRT